MTIETRPLVADTGPADVVDLDIFVPADCDVDIRSNIGYITVRGLWGNISAEADMGSISVSDTTGNLDLRAKVGGKIDVRGAEVTTTMILDADMGSVTFQGWP